MKVVFLGTRGEIDLRTPSHLRHSSLAVCYRRRRVMIDAGLDWLGRLRSIRPRAIVLTHAHPDHIDGLSDGAPCPVFACAATWDRMDERRFPLSRRTLEHRVPSPIEGIAFEAFPVEHSIRAPAVGYRITAGRVSIFYAPDLLYIQERHEALRKCKLYVGDGATMTRPIVRRHGNRIIGHAPVRTQLSWLAEEKVPRAIFTHCGSGIVGGEPARLSSRLEEMARHYGVVAEFPFDGMALVLR
jgi:phosphoribosyl 1,2-cyclic phosphodiesterase